MKLWIKTIICLMLVFIIALSPITTGILKIRKAEASFIPFIVENKEWILALLAGMGITVSTNSDAFALVHEFAYSLDNALYDSLQNYIDKQKLISATKQYIALEGLKELGIIDELYSLGTSIIQKLVTSQTISLEYVIGETIPTTIVDDYIQFPYVEGMTINYIIDSINSGNTNILSFYDITTEKIQSYSLIQNNDIMTIAGMSNPFIENIDIGDSITLSIKPRTPLKYSLQYNNLRTSASWWLGNVFSYNMDNVVMRMPISLSNVDISVTENISADLHKEDVQIEPRIADLDLPTVGIDHPLKDKYINVPKGGINDIIGKSAIDLIYQPAIDNFNNPVLDNLGNPVYEPVPQTWPNTQSPAYPPWPLSPDIEGVAEGTGVIGGILENIRDWVGDIGTFLTTDLPRILTTDIPIAIENIFNNPPPGDNENDVSDKMKDFKFPDLIFLFFGVILACIRLMIRFITFLTSLLLRPADSSIIPAGMKESLNFLKNWSIGLPVSFYTLFSSLMAFFFGLRMIKYIKIFVANVHGGITQSYDPREFNDNQVYNEWSRSGYKTEYSDYRKVYDTWKDSNSNLPWKGYLKREAKGRKW